MLTFQVIAFKKNSGESKQASLFQQVTRRRSLYSDFKGKEGVCVWEWGGWRIENRYIYKGKILLAFWAQIKSWVVDIYFSCR